MDDCGMHVIEDQMEKKTLILKLYIYNVFFLKNNNESLVARGTRIIERRHLQHMTITLLELRLENSLLSLLRTLCFLWFLG